MYTTDIKRTARVGADKRRVQQGPSFSTGKKKNSVFCRQPSTREIFFHVPIDELRAPPPSIIHWLVNRTNLIMQRADSPMCMSAHGYSPLLHYYKTRSL